MFAILVWVVLNKTTFGYELKACGSNRHAAKYAGMNDKRNIIISMAIAGALAAIGGSLYYLNPGIEFNFVSAYSKLPDYGFNGIPVALLASNNPIGVIFTGLFLRYIAQGGDHLTSANYNRYIADIIIALIIYFSGFSKLIKDVITARRKKREQKTAEKLQAAAEQKPVAEEVVTEDKEENIFEEIKDTIEEEEDSSPVHTDKKEVE